MTMLVAAIACTGCGGARPSPGSTLGGIHGVARDHDTGQVIEHAQVRLRVTGSFNAMLASSGADGSFKFVHLRPGTYSLNAEFAGQPIDVEGIEIVAGATVPVDLPFTLGRPDPTHVDFGDPKLGAIDRYRSPELALTEGRIEGTVTDLGVHTAVPGAAVTAVGPAGVQIAVTDDNGRYRFASVEPGTYELSAYYSIAGHGQIEVRRASIQIAGGEAVIVPLWIESAKE
jgi:hypothetical protein